MTVIFLSTHFAIFGCIIDLHQPEQVLPKVRPELFALVSDHFLWFPEALSGPKRSAWTRWPGLVRWGRNLHFLT